MVHLVNSFYTTRFRICSSGLLWFALVLTCVAAEQGPLISPLPDIASVEKDLETPVAMTGPPAPGQRVRQVTRGYESTEVYHTLYLPSNWDSTRSWPVIVEYPGNAYVSPSTGDTCSGTVEGSNLGYGISGGSNYIWICLPFVEAVQGRKQNARTWWGTVAETLAYCTNTLRSVCQEFHGNTNAILLTGFSRGAIGCNYIGLHNDAIASIWRAFIVCSHYDGVNTNWPYPHADRASALARLRRLQGRPQFICHEGSTASVQNYLQSTGVLAPFTFVDVPFRNHSDQWVLRKNTARDALRQWLGSLGLP
jgi:hypothetical protein